MKTAGRASPILILGALSVLALGLLLFSSSDTPTRAAADFMTALGTRDVDRLVELSYTPGKGKEEMRKAWDYTVNTVGRYYKFAFGITATKQADEKNATVHLQIYRNADLSNSYGEKIEIPLVKTDEGWLVDVFSLNRTMYPGLPRP